MATATVSFGLVSIPIRLYSATERSSSVSLNWLHGECGSRLKQQYICPKDGVIVDRQERVKGYQFAKDQYVTFSEEELASLSVKATQSVDIVEFLPVEQVDPIYFEKSYFLGPNKGGERPYRLLAAAMKKTGKVALARYAARGKDYLVLLRPFADGLIMHQLRYHDELKELSEVPLGDVEVAESELALAIQLVEQISNERFEPEKYKDEQRDDLWKLIQQKVEGREVTVAPSEAPKAQIIDLMEALKASISAEASADEAPREIGEQRAAANE